MCTVNYHCISTISWEHSKHFYTCQINTETPCNIFGDFMNSVLHSKPFTAVCLNLQMTFKCVLWKKRNIPYMRPRFWEKWAPSHVAKPALQWSCSYDSTVRDLCASIWKWTEIFTQDYVLQRWTQNTNLVFYIMCPWVRLTRTRHALNVLSNSFFLWLDFFPLFKTFTK